MDLSTLKLWNGPFSMEEVSVLFFIIIIFFIEINVINANSEDPNQMLHSVASDLGLTVCQCPFCGMLIINGLSSCFV